MSAILKDPPKFPMDQPLKGDGEHPVALSFPDDERFLLRFSAVLELEGVFPWINLSEKTEPPVAKPPEKQPRPEPKEPEKPPEPLRSAKGSKPVAPLVIGLAGLGVGLGFGAWALGLKGTVTDKCNTSSHQCSDEQGRDAAKLGTPVATVSTVGTVIGVLGLGTWLLWPSRKETSTAQLDAGPIAGGGMVRWYGSW
jgi:hypothetical protein